ncbi:hypothetical protein FBEOM_3238 [Fusarium beomiforme]|uniref:Uncharacterized protein n=1 Tax=Fusarium beomiforme TaxID=44412 RepID=A0A9P5AQG4_9HYPO|nr:hypothetical protein FBEOM_3238 [Fusarium beomiforme]
MSSTLTTTVNIISALIYSILTPTGSVIDANPTATTIELKCPNHPKIDCHQPWTNTFVIGPWASTVVPKGSPSTGTMHWLWEIEKQAVSMECQMSSGIRQTCTGIQVPLGFTTWVPPVTWNAHTWTVTRSEEMFDLTQVSIVITTGQELLGISTRKSSSEIPPPVTTTLFIFGVGDYAQGSASTGTFEWSLSYNARSDVSVNCFMRSGTPRTCTYIYKPFDIESDPSQSLSDITDSFTATEGGSTPPELKFGTRIPIIITAGKELFESIPKATATDTESSTEIESNASTSTEAPTSTVTEAPHETNGAGSHTWRCMGAVFIAGLASLIINSW